MQLADDARLLIREEILLGRHGETSGRVRQRVSVRYAGRPLYRQDLEVGTHPQQLARGISGPAELQAQARPAMGIGLVDALG